MGPRIHTESSLLVPAWLRSTTVPVGDELPCISSLWATLEVEVCNPLDRLLVCLTGLLLWVSSVWYNENKFGNDRCFSGHNFTYFFLVQPARLSEVQATVFSAIFWSGHESADSESMLQLLDCREQPLPEPQCPNSFSRFLLRHVLVLALSTPFFHWSHCWLVLFSAGPAAWSLKEIPGLLPSSIWAGNADSDRRTDSAPLSEAFISLARFLSPRMSVFSTGIPRVR